MHDRSVNEATYVGKQGTTVNKAISVGKYTGKRGTKGWYARHNRSVSKARR